ncbi:ATP synthase mitochondrial F1 complex assembly factor 2-like [Symsagittifera roscoffensis]|uniref:ATP synthase mitochondrial F1 complex assembly factor 2-like n=1 Tax=Symsagittifera roscoffensis TaxID=84072 RepID=UPI00307BA185
MNKLCLVCSRSLTLSSRLGNSQAATKKLKRFYRDVSIKKNTSESESLNDDFSPSFNIYLDKRCLKTPGGKQLDVGNESLAVGIADEWTSQKEFIFPTSMHFTSLINSCIDNPLNLTREEITSHLINQLDCDAILIFESENEELLKIQNESLSPIIAWINQELNTSLKASKELLIVEISDDCKSKIAHYLEKFNFETLMGLKFAVDSLKSMLLTIAAFEQKIDCETAIQLSRLEEEFQIAKWGNVEWAHDVNRLEVLSRFSSAILFATFSSEMHYRINGA